MTYFSCVSGPSQIQTNPLSKDKVGDVLHFFPTVRVGKSASTERWTNAFSLLTVNTGSLCTWLPLEYWPCPLFLNVCWYIKSTFCLYCFTLKSLVSYCFKLHCDSTVYTLAVYFLKVKWNLSTWNNNCCTGDHNKCHMDILWKIFTSSNKCYCQCGDECWWKM